MKTVMFCGHSNINCDYLKDKLYETVEKLIFQGATEFLLGGYGKFDSLCAKTVKELKKIFSYKYHTGNSIS